MNQPRSTIRSIAPTRRLNFAPGPWLVLASAVTFSTAGLFTRSIAIDAVTMLFWRNLLGGLILLLVALRHLHLPPTEDRPRAVAIVVLSACGSICYIAAFAFTSVANVSVIYAAAPMLTSALAWIALRERLARRTLASVLAAFAGVALTSFGSVRHGSLLGDGLALTMTLALSAVAVLSRGSALSPLTLSCASALLAALAIVPADPVLILTCVQFLDLAAFGVITMAIALPCYLAGLRSVSAGRAMLISAIELPLAPFWVWAAFGERPTVYAEIGGAIICAAIGWEVWAHPR